MILIEDGLAPEEILPIIFCDEPVASPHEEMEVDQLVLWRNMLGFIESRNPFEPLF
jgi:hypothetical protein